MKILTSVIGAGCCFLSAADIKREFWKTDAEIDEFYKNCVEERGAASQHESLATYLKAVGKADKMPAIESVPMLGEMLRKVGRTNIFQVPERSNVYDTIQKKLLSIPGHAQYFSDEIERLIADPANGSDVRERYWYLQETLPHLPSPESIRVLGNYLNDERFAPIKGYDNSGATGASSYLATNALRWIGLRESEDVIRTEKGSHYSDLGDLRKMRAWWEEIKSGRRTFSFKGQNVEYRFKPDGTWETIAMTNPPDDGPQSNAAVLMPDRAARPAKQPPPPPSLVTPPPPRNYWWLIGCVISVLVAVGFLIKRRLASWGKCCGGR